MTECTYHVAMIAAVALGALASFFATVFLYEKFKALRDAFYRYEGFSILIPLATAVAIFFVMSREVPKVIEITDCGTGARLEKIVLKPTATCTVALK